MNCKIYESIRMMGNSVKNINDNTNCMLIPHINDVTPDPH